MGRALDVRPEQFYEGMQNGWFYLEQTQDGKMAALCQKSDFSSGSHSNQRMQSIVQVTVSGDISCTTPSSPSLIGAKVRVLKVEVNQAKHQVDISQDTPLIGRIDTNEFDQILSWQRMASYRKIFEFEHHESEATSFIFGEADYFSDDICTALQRVSSNAFGKICFSGNLCYAMVKGTNDSNKCLNFLHDAKMEEMERVYDQVKSDEKPFVFGYKISSIQLAIPFDSSEFLPIHSWLLMMKFLDADDVEWKEELENNGYYRLADSEAKEEDVKHGLEDKEFFVMCRHELVNIRKPYAGLFSRQTLGGRMTR